MAGTVVAGMRVARRMRDFMARCLDRRRFWPRVGLLCVIVVRLVDRIEWRQRMRWIGNIVLLPYPLFFLTPTPLDAVAALFAIYAAPGTRVVLNAMRSNRREVRWNGFMWEDWP